MQLLYIVVMCVHYLCMKFGVDILTSLKVKNKLTDRRSDRHIFLNCFNKIKCKVLLQWQSIASNEVFVTINLHFRLPKPSLCHEVSWATDMPFRRFYTVTAPDNSLLALPFFWKEMTSTFYYNWHFLHV